MWNRDLVGVNISPSFDILLLILTEINTQVLYKETTNENISKNLGIFISIGYRARRCVLRIARKLRTETIDKFEFVCTKNLKYFKDYETEKNMCVTNVYLRIK